MEAILQHTDLLHCDRFRKHIIVEPAAVSDVVVFEASGLHTSILETCTDACSGDCILIAIHWQETCHLSSHSN